MSHSPLWLIRAGEKAAFAKGFRSGNYIAIGWKEVGPVSPDTPDEEIDRLFAVHYPQKDDNTRNVWANQVRQYHREIRSYLINGCLNPTACGAPRGQHWATVRYLSLSRTS